jgi:ABC-type molybdate transport system permease subunit
MKRGFLFGLGSLLFLGVLGGLAEALGGYGCTLALDGECQAVGNVIMIALCASLSALAIWKATAAAPNKSWLHAIGGWLIGFCIIHIVWITLITAVAVIIIGAK